MEPFFIAHVCLFGGNFAPRGWAFCWGQQMSIAQYTALFSLVGTTYGGNGQTTFGLPDFRGRIPVGHGQGPGLAPVDIGEMGGWNSVTLLSQNMPQHSHVPTAAVGVNSATGNTTNPAGAVISGGPANTYAPAAHVSGNLAGVVATVNPAGGNQPFSNEMPSLGMNFVIALEGIYPARN